MIQPNLILIGLLPLAWACGGSIPPPTQRLADAQSAERSARELGAEQQPEAQLSLKLAGDQIELAQAAMAKEENAKADVLLLRAQADAELAIARARQSSAQVAHQAAVNDARAQSSINIGQGARQ